MQHPELFGRVIGHHYDALRERFRDIDNQLIKAQIEVLSDNLLGREIPIGVSRGRPRELTELGRIFVGLEVNHH